MISRNEEVTDDVTSKFCEKSHIQYMFGTFVLTSGFRVLP